MGCGCGSQHQVALPGRPTGPRLFLATSDAEFLRSLGADELKDKKRLLAYFHMLSEGQFEVTTAFVAQVRRKGVPPRYRWQAWRALSGWSSLYKPGMYERLSQREPDRKVVDAVQKDLDRTFPKLEEFDAEKKRHMGSVVKAYACLVPQVGYCQGMNFIAGFLLLASGSSHEDAFFMFVHIMAKYRASLLFCEGLPLLKLLTFQFKALLEKLFPEVHRHFLYHNITPELYVTKWMLTVFTQPLDFDSAARVWDVIVCDGIEAVVLVCLASVQLLKARLLASDIEGILEILSLHKDTTPPTGGEIVQATLNLKLPGRVGLQACLSKLRDDWVQEHQDVAAELGRAELAFCTADGPSGGLLEPPSWHPPVSEAAEEPEVKVPPGPIVTPHVAELATSPVAAPAGSPIGAMPGHCFAAASTLAPMPDYLPAQAESTNAHRYTEGLEYTIGAEAKIEVVTASCIARPSGVDGTTPTMLVSSPLSGPVSEGTSLDTCSLSPRGPAATPLRIPASPHPLQPACTTPEADQSKMAHGLDAEGPSRHPKASPWTSPGRCRQTPATVVEEVAGTPVARTAADLSHAEERGAPGPIPQVAEAAPRCAI